MKQMFAPLFLSLLSAVLVGQAHADTCLDQGLVDTIKSSLQLNLNDGETFDRCQNSTRTYKMLEALSLLKTMKFENSNLAQPFNQNILPEDFWGYFSSGASIITDEPTTSATCTAGVMAFVYVSGGDGTVHICPSFYDQNFSVFERAQAMLHEVRHFAGYRHITCTRGPRANKAGACDDSINEKGSYAVTVESLTKMAMEGKNMSRAQQSMLKSMAVTYASEAFEEPVKSTNLNALYLLSDDHHGFMLSANDLFEVTAIETGKLISRQASLNVFPLDKSDAYTANVFSPALDPLTALGSGSTKYNKLSQASRPTMIDILNLPYLSAVVHSQDVEGQLTSLTDPNDNTHINLPWTAKAVYGSQELGLRDSKDSIYVVSEQDQMVRVQFLADHKYNVGAVTNPATGFKSIVIFNDQRLGLNENGEIQQSVSGQWQSYDQFKQRRFSVMTRPFAWDQYFEEPGTNTN